MARVILAKPGLDGHEAGVLLVARALIDAGFEVIYLGSRQSAQAIAEAAVQEDADVVGLSVLTGGHMVHCDRVLAALRDADAGDIPLVVGGIIPDVAANELRERGVACVFGPGEPLPEIVGRIRELTEPEAVASA
jgi:methylmalonyl-CoA mutase C-terminal domain/subunit